MSCQSLWSHPNLDERKFVALIKLLSLCDKEVHLDKSTAIENSSELGDTDYQSEDEDESIDTARADLISDLENQGLKKRFLDRLAELASTDRGGKFVACAVMIERGEEVKILVARNTSLNRADFKFLHACAGYLERLASKGLVGPDRAAVEGLLWSRVLSHSHQRIAGWYIPRLKKSFRACKDIIDRAGSNLGREPAYLFERLRANVDSRDHHLLVCLAYELRNLDEIASFLQESAQSNAQTRKLFNNLCFLARPRTAFFTFTMAADAFASFQKVKTSSITPKDMPPYKAPSNPLNLRETLKLLDFDLSSKIIKQYVNPKLSVSQAEEQFTKLHKQSLYIHAEIQMALHLQSSSSKGILFPYIGCSKYSCSLCNQYLQQVFGEQMTRGCHGTLYSKWMVSTRSRLSSEQAETISNTVLYVQNALKKALRSPVKKKIAPPHEKESTCGLPVDDLDPSPSLDSFVAAEFRRAQLKAIEYDKSFESVIRVKRSDGKPIIDSRPEISEDTSTSTLPKDHTGQCLVCEKETSRRCSHCHRDWFCSLPCEATEVLTHVFNCNKRPITSADYLFIDLIQDVLPTDPDVRTDFGFQDLMEFNERSRLLGLYQGLYHLGISPTILHEWQIKGCLRSKIIETYSKLDLKHQGGYYPWFLKNKHILSTDTKKSAARPQLPFSVFLTERARPYLHPSDQSKEIEELQPTAKRQAYEYLKMAILGWHPHPPTELWFNFGFCVCKDERTESALASIYNILLIGTKHDELRSIQTSNARPAMCTFEEFWKAYESKQLLQLIDSKGLRDLEMSSTFRNLENFFITQHSSSCSVWRLVQYLTLTDSEAVFGRPSLGVWVHYGFQNCTSDIDRQALREIYNQILQHADPLDLHAACLEGKLFSFISNHIQIDSRYKGILTNREPLPEI